MKADKRPWTEDDIAILTRMVGTGKKSFAAVGAKLGRSADAVESKYRKLKDEPERAATMNNTRGPIVAPSASAERDKRLAATHSTITAAFFGDPPPGYSALDQLRAEGRAI